MDRQQNKQQREKDQNTLAQKKTQFFSAPEPVKSELDENDKSLMRDHHVDHITKQKLAVALLKEGIRIDERHFQQTLRVLLRRSTPNLQAVTLEICFGHLRVLVDVACVPKKGVFHCGRPEEATFATIYTFQRDYSIKCFSTKSSFEKIFADALKEYSVLRIASILKLGPVLPKLFGFDLIVFDSCVEFAMETCSGILRSPHIQEDLLNLKEKLQFLHSFGVIHGDIKPDNIMFSRERETCVMIDFGMSESLMERVGFKTKSRFFGSINYCSKDMLSAFRVDYAVYVDLYLNDYVSLSKSTQQILKSKQQNIEQISDFLNDSRVEEDPAWDIICSNCFSHSALLFSKELQLKHFLFKQFELEKGQLVMSSLPNHSCRDLVQFIRMLPFSDNQLFFLEELDRVNNCRENPYFDFQAVRASVKRKKGNFILKDLKCVQTISEKEGKGKVGGLFESNQMQSSIVSTFLTRQLENYWVLSEESIQRQTKSYYIKSYVDFVDITAGISTFEEKKKAAELFIRILAVDKNDLALKTQWEKLSTTFKFIFQSYRSQLPDFFESILPTTLKNLLILGSWESSKIISESKSLLRLKVSDNKIGVKLFIEVSKLLSWVDEKTTGKFEDLLGLKNYCCKDNCLMQENNSSYLQKAFELFHRLKALVSEGRSLDFAQIQKSFWEDDIDKEDVEELVLLGLFGGVSSVNIFRAYSLKNKLAGIIERYENVVRTYPEIEYYDFKLISYLNPDLRKACCRRLLRKTQKCFDNDQFWDLFYGVYKSKLLRSMDLAERERCKYLLTTLNEAQRQICKSRGEEEGSFIFSSMREFIQLKRVSDAYQFLANEDSKQLPSFKADILCQMKKVICPSFFDLLKLEIPFKQFELPITSLLKMLSEVYVFLYRTQSFCLPALLKVIQQLQLKLSSVSLNGLQRIKTELNLAELKLSLMELLSRDQITFSTYNMQLNKALRISSHLRKEEKNAVKYLLLQLFRSFLRFLAPKAQMQFDYQRVSSLLLDFFMAQPQQNIEVFFSYTFAMDLLKRISSYLFLHGSVRQFIDFHVIISNYIENNPTEVNVFSFDQTICSTFLEYENFMTQQFMKEFWAISRPQIENSPYLILLCARVVLMKKIEGRLDGIVLKLFSKIDLVVPYVKRALFRIFSGYFITMDVFKTSPRKSLYLLWKYMKNQYCEQKSEKQFIEVLFLGQSPNSKWWFRKIIKSKLKNYYQRLL